MYKDKGPFEALKDGDANTVIHWIKRHLGDLCRRMANVKMIEIVECTLLSLSMLTKSKNLSNMNSNEHGVVHSETIENKNNLTSILHQKYTRCKLTFALT